MSEIGHKGHITTTSNGVKIFNGKKEAERILKDLKTEIKKRKIKPKLAVILIGNNAESKLYIKLKKKAAKKVRIEIAQHNFQSTANEERIIKKIDNLNNDESVDGIIVQLPLPKKFNKDRIIKKISAGKDVDGFHSPFFDPVLPSAILFVLEKIKTGKKVLAIVNSDFFGKALQEFLGKQGWKVNYLVDKKKSLSRIQKEKVVVAVCGCPRFIKSDMIKSGAVLIDGGISRIRGKAVGDVDKESVKNKAAFLAPVPGGLGPLTVALLLKNVYLAATKHHEYS